MKTPSQSHVATPGLVVAPANHRLTEINYKLVARARRRRSLIFVCMCMWCVFTRTGRSRFVGRKGSTRAHQKRLAVGMEWKWIRVARELTRSHTQCVVQHLRRDYIRRYFKLLHPPLGSFVFVPCCARLLCTRARSNCRAHWLYGLRFSLVCTTLFALEFIRVLN